MSGFSMDGAVQVQPSAAPPTKSRGFQATGVTEVKPGQALEKPVATKPNVIPRLDISSPFKSGLTKENLTKAVSAVMEFEKQGISHPLANPLALARGTIGFGEWAAEKAAEGIVGLIRMKGWNYNSEAAQAAASRVHDAIEKVNQAGSLAGPLGGLISAVKETKETPEEEAMKGLLGVIGEVPGAVGDTVFDRTGSALAATGALTLTTALMLKPGSAAKVFGKVKDVVPGTKAPTRIKAAFDELAAKDPHGASALAGHIEQVDPLTAKYMQRRIKKFTDASEEELSLISRNAADAAIKSMEGNYDEIIKGGTVAGPPTPGQQAGFATPSTRRLMDVHAQAAEQFRQRAQAETESRAEMLRKFDATNRQAQANLRTAAKEGTESLTGFKKVGETPEGKPRVRAGGADDVVYFNSGIPVTREHIRQAFEFGGDLLRKVPGVAIAQGKMERLYDGYIRTFNPEAVGPDAKTAGAAIAQNFFKQSEAEHRIWQQGKVRRGYWQQMGGESQISFMDQFESGRRFDNPDWQAARDGYLAWGNQIANQDARTWAASGKDIPYDPLDHYLPHLFERPQDAIVALEKMFGTKWADPRFTKKRGFNTYAEARRAGLELEKQGKPNPFKPKTTNPEEIFQARQMASDIAALRTDLLADFERKGIARRANPGDTRPPPGFSPNSRRSPTGVRYWIREAADPIMHNAFDSKSLWADPGLKGDAFRGYMELKNRIVPIKLAASAFHPMHVMHIDASAELTRSTNLLLGAPSAAHVRDFILNTATSVPFTPGALYRSLWDNPKTGYPLLRVFQGKRDFATLSDSEKAAYKDLTESGLVPTRPREETSSAMQQTKDAWAKGNYVRSAVFHFPFAMLQSLVHPIYSLWIPSLKIASLLKDAKVWRELNPGHTDMQRQEALRRAAYLVETRYGEMNYSTLFMNKLAKDIGVATNLSLGWNIGLLDQYVGGAIDLGKVIGKEGSLKQKAASGMLDRPVFVAYYVGSALAVGGLMHYMFTGKQPQSLVDYTHPESGEKDQYGKPIRLNTMFYTREFEGLYKHMQEQGVVPGLKDFVINKGSGMVEMGRAAISGIDGLGQDIRDPEGPLYKQLEQTLAYELSELEPISIEAIGKSTGSPVKMGVLSGLGFTPAGKYISETVLEGQISDRYNRYVRPKEKPFQAVEMSKDTKKLRSMFNSNDPKYDDQLDEMRTKYGLDNKDVRKMEKMFNSPKEQNFDPSIFMFSHLPWEVQKEMLGKMTDEEREQYLPHLSKQKRKKFQASQEGDSK